MKLSKEQLLLILKAMDCYRNEVSKTLPEEYNSTIKEICNELVFAYKYPINTIKDSNGNYSIYFPQPSSLISMNELASLLRAILNRYLSRFINSQIYNDLFYEISFKIKFIEDRIKMIMPHDVRFELNVKDHDNIIGVNINFYNCDTPYFISDERLEEYSIDKYLSNIVLENIETYLKINP